MKKTAEVIDLDGTLIDCNSFTLYVKRMMWRHPKIILAALARKLRLISHARAKQIIIGVKITDKELDDFVCELTRHVRTEILTLTDSDMRILATAAPFLYSKPLAEKTGFDFIVSTEMGGVETKGEIKLREVQKICNVHNLVISKVITDHKDDMPLIETTPDAEHILVNPTEKFASEVKIRDKNVKIFGSFRKND